MNDKLTLGKAGQELIKGFESCVLKAYVDTHDKEGLPVYAIGWGHSSNLGYPHVYEGMTITKERADEMFLNDAKIFENKVKHYVDVPLNQNQFDALVSTAYNVSTQHFIEIIEKSGLNKGNYKDVPKILLEYDKSGGKQLKGLTRRRKEEGVLFSTPVGKLRSTDIVVPDIPVEIEPIHEEPKIVAQQVESEPAIEKKPRKPRTKK